MSAQGPIRVLIIGGGFAGLGCARRLERRLHTLFGRRKHVAGLPLDAQLSECLDARAVTVTTETGVTEAVTTLRREGLKRLVVVEPASPRRVAGILSRLDLVRAHLGRKH